MTANPKKQESISQERRVKCYPAPKYHVLFIGYQNLNEMKQSEAGADIIRQFFENMPESQRRACLNEGMKIAKSKHQY